MRDAPARDSSVIWHEVECGSYDADLPLWEELADGSGPILDLGCGTGRVARHLARRKHEAVGLDANPAFVAELVRDGGVGVVGDARDFALEREFELVLAPMQLMQLFADSDERVACLECVERHLADGGLAAFAIVESMPAPVDAAPPLPDTREVEGWVYSSLPIEAATQAGTIRIRRLRQTVSPGGELGEEVDEVVLRSLDAATFEREAVQAGLQPAGRRPIQRHRRACRLDGRPALQGSLMELRLLALYPEQMNIYADRGNILFLRRRCEWRGIGFSYAASGPGEGFDPGGHDLLYLGGGQDRDQRAVAADMVASKRAAIAAAVGDGAVLLAVCGGYQLLGHSYQLDDEKLPGLGLADLETVREPGPRLIGNVAIEVDLGDGPRTVAGFENHGGRTYLGKGAEPLGRVVSGFGNNGKDGFEGVRRGNLIGTYLHGPLLPKNAWLADRLIAWALERRYGSAPELEPLDDELELAAEVCAREVALDA